MNRPSFFLAFIILALLLPLHSKCQAYDEDVIHLKNGSVVRGIIIEQIPEQSVKIQTADKSVLVFKMDEIEKIDKASVNIKKKTSSRDNSKFYIEIYFFGGSSYGKMTDNGTATIDGNYSHQNVAYEVEYKNGGLGGLGISYLSIGKNRRPDFMIDCEVAIYGASMKVTTFDPSASDDFSGYSECVDFHFSLYPFKARNKYPSPYIMAGAGMRMVKFAFLAGDVSELHGDFLFGLGIRQKISRVVAFQLGEQFVYSKLKDVHAFILPETRLSMIFSL
ncbi:MAG: hypothetical protein NTU98_14305 [Bacteroidetes bacterium]|nr:hypothetical protein [Bacteroidota bacterium]